MSEGIPEGWKIIPVRKYIKESRISGSTGDKAKKLTVKLYGKGVFAKYEKRPGSERTKYYIRKSGHLYTAN